MRSLAFVLRMVWRETRATPRRLLVLAAATAVGVAALVAIDSFTANLRTSVAGQAQALLGADLALSSRQPLPADVIALADSLACGRAAPPCPRTGGRVAREASFSAMAYVPRTSGARLVQLRAVEPGFPFYGENRTDPAGAWSTLREGRRALVDPSLLAALGARVGDSLSLGETRFVIAGTIVSTPGDVGIEAVLGPRVFVSYNYLPETKLLGFGARAQYSTYVKLPPGGAAQSVAERYRPPLRARRVQIRTVADDRSNLTDALTRLGNYLGLIALTALLLGGLGTASAVNVLLRRRLDSIAVLRCLGATAAQVFAIYVLQAATIALVGSAAGVGLGILLQRAIPAALQDFIPVDVQVALAPAALIKGLGVGLWVALIFALLPLLAVRRVPPLAVLRRDVEPPRGARDPLRWPAAALLALSVVTLSALQVGNWRRGGAFALGIGVAILGLWLLALGLIRGVRRWFPSGWPYVWRQGLANLYRPANQTVTVVLAIGFGAFLLAVLLLAQHTLLRQLDIAGGGRRANVLLFDIQPDQRAGVDSVLRAARFPTGAMTPIVPMRILSLKGHPVAGMLDTTATPAEAPRGRRPGSGPAAPGGWALRREYRSTYRDTVVASEKVVAGTWWKKGAAPGAISLEQGLATELGVGLGDQIVWDVQGVPVTTHVTSLREVEWARFEPNFFVVFAPGAIDGAPQTFATLTRAEQPARRGSLQRSVAERYSNVTTIDLAQVQQSIERLIDRIVLAIRFMALFTVAAGAVVLVGAVATTRYQRIREGALLRTLGATRSQVLRMVLAEYLALGILAGLAAIALAGAAGWALARWLFDAPFALPGVQLAALALVVAGGTALLGLLNSVDVVRRTPLEVLRAE